MHLLESLMVEPVSSCFEQQLTPRLKEKKMTMEMLSSTKGGKVTGLKGKSLISKTCIDSLNTILQYNFDSANTIACQTNNEHCKNAIVHDLTKDGVIK